MGTDLMIPIHKIYLWLGSGLNDKERCAQALSS